MPLDDRYLARELKSFFKKELGSLEEATGRAIKIAANSLANKIRGQLTAGFQKTDHPNSPQFFKAVKAYHLEPRADGLGYASFVRMGMKKFMYVFEEGALISANKKAAMVIRTEMGRKLGFPRVNAKGKLSDILAKVPKNRIFVADKNGGKIVFYKVSKGKYIPIYKIQTPVVLGRRISFHKTAEQEWAKIAELIDRFNNG